MKDFRKDLRKTLAQLERNGYTMADWADEAGANRSTVWRILKGRQVPSVETFLAMQTAATKLLPKAA